MSVHYVLIKKDTSEMTPDLQFKPAKAPSDWLSK